LNAKNGLYNSTKKRALKVLELHTSLDVPTLARRIGIDPVWRAPLRARTPKSEPEPPKTTKGTFRSVPFAETAKESLHFPFASFVLAGFLIDLLRTESSQVNFANIVRLANDNIGR
jgi:hypothetical protein